MTTTILGLYKALVEAGIDEMQAEKVAETVLTKQEAAEFVTKRDLQIGIQDLKVDVYKAMMVQTGVTVTIVLGFLTLILQ